MSGGLRTPAIGALGGDGMGTGLPSSAPGSLRNSTIEGRIIPGPLVSLCCSNTAAVTGTCAVAAAGGGGEVGGEVTST